MTQRRSITCHMGSHSVTCHPTQVNTPALTPARQADTRLTYLGGMEGWVDLGDLLLIEMVYPPQTVTHPSTNRAKCRLTTLIEARRSGKAPYISSRPQMNFSHTGLKAHLVHGSSIFQLSAFCLMRNVGGKHEAKCVIPPRFRRPSLHITEQRKLLNTVCAIG